MLPKDNNCPQVLQDRQAERLISPLHNDLASICQTAALRTAGAFQRLLDQIPVRALPVVESVLHASTARSQRAKRKIVARSLECTVDLNASLNMFAMPYDGSMIDLGHRIDP